MTNVAKFEEKKIDLKYLFLIIGVIIVALCATVFLPYFKHQKIRFENKNLTAYEDRTERIIPGNSEIISFLHDSTNLKLCYILRTGFTYPYIGIQISLKDNSGSFFDCRQFDMLKIRIASSKQSDCKLYLRIFDTKVSRKNDPLSERYLKKDLILSSTPTTMSIPLRQFTTPEWWFQRNNITLKDINPEDFSKVTALQIESGSTAKTGVIDTLAISQIYLMKSPDKKIIALLLLLLGIVSVYTTFRLVPRRKNNPVIITYEKKEVSNYRDIDAQRISDYIAEHFSEAEISIVTMGEHLGLSQKKAAKIMNDVFKMSFKQYLTSVRIHEVKRLLLETDRLVIDIALAVGFNSISHFNRVFKTSTQLSPLEFRNRKSVENVVK